MARFGIAYQEVANAAQELLAQGKNPTIQNIRLIIGTGSNSTIAAHLNTWKNRQDSDNLLCSKEKIPDEIMHTIKGLWERLMAQADEKVAAIQQNLEQTITDIKNKERTLEESNQQWQLQCHQLTQENHGLTGDKSALEHIVKQLENESIALTAANGKMAQQLIDNKEQIDKLHQLNQQAQRNLEHYRDASREQRLSDQQRYEQLQAQLEQTIQLSKQEIMTLNQQYAALSHDYQQICFIKENAENQYHALANEYEALKIREADTEKRLIQYSQGEQHWKDHYHSAQYKIEQQEAISIDLKTQLAVLTETLKVAQDNLIKAQDKNDYLAQEKWQLQQERAQLQGQLKQILAVHG